MEILFIDPQVGREVETPSGQATPTHSAAGQTFGSRTFGKDAIKAIVPGPAEGNPKAPVVPRARNVVPAGTRVYRVCSPVRHAGRIASLAVPAWFAYIGFSLQLDTANPSPLWESVVLCAVGLWIAWAILRRPYILHVGRHWAEFVSLAGTRRVSAKEIRGIVRKKPESRPDEVNHLVIQLSRGSVTLQTGREEIVKALTRINPAARVTSEVYKDQP